MVDATNVVVGWNRDMEWGQRPTLHGEGRRAMFAWRRFRDVLDSYEIVVSSWMERHGYRLLRIAMGIIFIWFGALKPFGLSPAEALVARATAWIPIPGFLYVLAVWEVAIGVCFLYKPLVRWGVVLLCNL